MKKIYKTLLLIFIAFISFNRGVLADTIKFEGDNEFSGNEFTVYIVVNKDETKDSDIKVSLARLFDIQIDEKYSLENLSPKIEKINVEGIGDYTKIIYKKHLIAEVSDYSKEKAYPGKIVKITFKVTDDFKVGEELKITTTGGELVSGTQNTSKGVSKSVEKDTYTIKRVKSEEPEPPKKEPEQEPVKYTCQYIDGKYYSEDGTVVDKKTYESICGIKESPKTGASFSLIAIVIGILALIYLNLSSKNKNKMFKI